MQNPIVELDGDEMTRVLWAWIKDILIKPHVELNTIYYDLGLPERDKTNDQITFDAAEAIKKHKVGVKCATITPNQDRMGEYNLKQMWKSPNGTLRSALDGTVFRAPIIAKGIEPFIPTWTAPITVARHGYGDLYSGVEAKVSAGGTAKMVIEDENGVREIKIHDFAKGAGVVQSAHNTDSSIKSFAKSCFEYALATKQELWFATKDTISKTYHHRFKDLFFEVFENEGYDKKFATAGIEYFYTLIDDAVARVMRSNGGYIWACTNYDGDVMSDMVASAFGSLAMMTSVLVSPNGEFEFEAAHGTVTRHYYNWQKGGETSTNPVATIFAWTGAMAKRAELDKNEALLAFSKKLEKATVTTIENGFMTGDLVSLFKGAATPQKMETQAFLRKIAELM